jgi:spectinomycin phosphotransferase
MLEKPDLHNESILACVRESYGLATASIEFLPIGNDSSAWVYRANGDDGKTYFLKVKKGTIYEPSVLIPRYLRDSGIEQVVAPLATRSQKLWESIGDFALIVYPFIHGKVGMEVGLSDNQWREFGSFLKTLHTTQLPSELSRQVQTVTFSLNAKWVRVVRQLQAAIRHRDYDNPFEKELAAFWSERHEEIGKIVDRAEALGHLLQKRSSNFVLCHSDIHTANLLLAPDGKLFVVDWDQPILAPKERDLMFVVGNDAVEAREAELFLKGYGKTDVDALALAYYHYEWVVQEFGDYGERVFLRNDVGEETKRDAVRGFRQLFLPGDVVDAAYQSEADLPLRLKMSTI